MPCDDSARVLASVLSLALLSAACTSDEAPTDAGPTLDAPNEARATDALDQLGAPADAAAADTSQADAGPGNVCDGIPQCRFACPEGTVNPKDQNGCVHSCTCVFAAFASEGPVALKMYSTCGDPVCSGPRENPGVAMCGSAEVEGAACNIEGARCDRRNQCNQLLVCARMDPKTQPGGCPIAFTTRPGLPSDILPASEGGAYHAVGARIGSTLKP